MTATKEKEKSSESTELATVDTSGFLALQKDSGIREAIEANYGAGASISEQDMTRISTPTGGATSWTWESAFGEQAAKEIEGILVWHQVRGILWPYEDPSGTPPLLLTYDLLEARRLGSDTGDIDPDELEKHRLPNGNYNWTSLPWNQWGSGKNGGKRCKEQLVMFILKRDDAWPCIVTAQPGSLKSVRQFIAKMTMQGIPHYRAVVALGLSKEKNKVGQDYAQIKPRLTGVLDQKTGEAIKSMYTTPLSSVARSMSVESRFDNADE